MRAGFRVLFTWYYEVYKYMGRFPNLSMLGVGFCSFFGAFLFTYAQLGVFPDAPTLSFNLEEISFPNLSLETLKDQVAAVVTGIVTAPEVGPGEERIDPKVDTEATPADAEDAMILAATLYDGAPNVGMSLETPAQVSSEAGVDIGGTLASDTEIQTTAVDISWSESVAHAPWAARDSGASFVFRDRLWYMGGLNGDGLPGEDHVVKYWEATYFNDIWSSSDGGAWVKESTQASWSPRRSMSVAELGGVLFMYGGWSQTEGYVSDIWYSSDGYTWLRASTSTPWSPREGQTLEVFEGKLWLIGGVNYDERKVFNDVWYSDDGLTWKEAPASGVRWSGRWDHATAVHDGEVFLVGGMNLNKETFRDVWKTRDGKNWTQVGELPGATRQGHGLVSYRDELWTIGRLNDSEGGGENDIWYSKDGVVWNRAATLPPWIGREDHAVHVLNDTLYVYGGMSADWVWMNDVWRGRGQVGLVE